MLENAFKYAQKDAEIGFEITSNGLCIFDDGKKITKNENEKIFEKGFRGSAAKKKDGTGVGLYLARKLAKQIGGELRLVGNKSINNAFDVIETNWYEMKIKRKIMEIKDSFLNPFQNFLWLIDFFL